MSWIQTYKRQQIFPLDIKEEDIDIEDIALSLAKTCRYRGFCRGFYSVAQHSLLMCEHATPKNKLAALMHDAAESYLSDVAHPIKSYLVNFSDYEDKILTVIAKKYGFEFPLVQEIHELDWKAAATEKRDLMNPCKYKWGKIEKIVPFEEKIIPLENYELWKDLFLDKFYELTNKKARKENTENIGKAVMDFHKWVKSK